MLRLSRRENRNVEKSKCKSDQQSILLTLIVQKPVLCNAPLLPKLFHLQKKAHERSVETFFLQPKALLGITEFT